MRLFARLLARTTAGSFESLSTRPRLIEEPKLWPPFPSIPCGTLLTMLPQRAGLGIVLMGGEVHNKRFWSTINQSLEIMVIPVRGFRSWHTLSDHFIRYLLPFFKLVCAAVIHPLHSTSLS